MEFVSKVLLMTFVTIVIVGSFRTAKDSSDGNSGMLAVFVAKAFPFLICDGMSISTVGLPNSMIADNNEFALAFNMTLLLLFSPKLSQAMGKTAIQYDLAIPAIFTYCAVHLPA